MVFVVVAWNRERDDARGMHMREDALACGIWEPARRTFAWCAFLDSGGDSFALGTLLTEALAVIGVDARLATDCFPRQPNYG